MLANVYVCVGKMTKLSNKKHYLAALIGLALAGSVAAQAQQPTSAQTDAIRQSCRSEFMANCAGVQPGGKDALLCLKNHLGNLSAACKSAVSAVMPPAAKPSPVAAAGPADHKPPAAAHPANGSQPAAAPPTAPPPPPAVEPLKLRPFIMPQRRVIIVTICGSDVSSHCQGVPPGGERILECLAAHAAQLTPACYAAIKRVSEK
ncbi:MAG TPA: cysteine rich repeat-containing protein [Xanthobacteraceae bacterium]|nr:cysteine rich repeat-containing protein [Xanthobacteraceae bacterium]